MYVGKRQLGSVLTGSLQMLGFLSVAFAAAPLVLTPFVRNQKVIDFGRFTKSLDLRPKCMVLVLSCCSLLSKRFRGEPSVLSLHNDTTTATTTTTTTTTNNTNSNNSNNNNNNDNNNNDDDNNINNNTNNHHHNNNNNTNNNDNNNNNTTTTTTNNTNNNKQY